MQVNEIIDKVINNDITAIDISVIKLSRDEIQRLTKALEINTSVISIETTASNLEQMGAFYFAMMLKTNKSITSVDFRSNNIGSLGAQYFAEALAINKSIISIKLAYNLIDSLGIKSLTKAFEVNSNLAVIDISHNSFREEDMQEIAKVFEVNKSITKVYLECNQINTQGAKTLAKSLEMNASLTEIYLNNNIIEDEGAKAFAEFFKTSKSLIFISFNLNQIGDEGAKYIAEALKGNNSLAKMHLAYNQIGLVGLNALLEAIEINNTIIEMDITNNLITDETVQQGFEQAINKNNRIKRKIETVIEFANNKMYDMAYKALDTVLTIKAHNQNLIVDIDLLKAQIFSDHLCNLDNVDLLEIPNISLESTQSQEKFLERFKYHLAKHGINKGYIKLISNLMVPNALIQKVEDLIRAAQEKVAWHETDIISFTEYISPVPLLLLASETRMKGEWKYSKDKKKYFTTYKKLYPEATDLITKLQEGTINDNERSQLIKCIKDNFGLYLEQIELENVINYITEHEIQIEDLVALTPSKNVKTKLIKAKDIFNKQCPYEIQQGDQSSNIHQAFNDDGYASMDDTLSASMLVLSDDISKYDN